VPVGTPVRVIDQDVRLAWIAGELYLAVNPSKEQIDELSTNQRITSTIPIDLIERVAEAAGVQAERIDWAAVERIALQRHGIPLRITKSYRSDKNSDPDSG
jgi:L,D-transpeptidase ErfK/SrfK